MAPPTRRLNTFAAAIGRCVIRLHRSIGSRVVVRSTCTNAASNATAASRTAIVTGEVHA